MVFSAKLKLCRCERSAASAIRPQWDSPILLPLEAPGIPLHKADDTDLSPGLATYFPPDMGDMGIPLRVLIAPSGYKESLGPELVADAIEKGVRRALKDQYALVCKLPLYDGGEGFCRSLVSTKGGSLLHAQVKGPTGLDIRSHLGFVGSNHKTAVIEIATVAGLRLVPKYRRDPTITSTYGVGQLIQIALDKGCSKIIVGCGDSGTSDGGAGMLQALGARLLDKDGLVLPQAKGGGSLALLDNICWCNIHPRLRNSAEEKVEIEVVCNIKNLLCGPKGVARVYGPQKGATPDQVELLEEGLKRLAQVAERQTGTDISETPGSGASGGIGTGLLLLGASLRPCSEAVDEYFGLEDALKQQWDIVITGEGSLDSKSVQGKMTTEVARRARDRGAQVIALAGTIGEGVEDCHKAGIAAFTSILKGPSTLEKAISENEKLLEDEAEEAMRMIVVGLTIGRREAHKTPSRRPSRRSQNGWTTRKENRRSKPVYM